MFKRSWPVLVVGFGSMLGLMILSLGWAISRFQSLHRESVALQNSFQDTKKQMMDLRIHLSRSGLLLRDFLLDRSAQSFSPQQQELREVRGQIELQLDSLEKTLAKEGIYLQVQLKTEIEQYLDLLEPVFQWDLEDRWERGNQYLRKEIVPRREIIQNISDQISDLSDQSFKQEQIVLEQKQKESRKSLIQIMFVLVVLGGSVSGYSIIRILRLERQTEQQVVRAERAEEEMRHLSRQMAQAQEEERKAISRDLHDEVGQTLTALRMNLTTLAQNQPEASTEVQECLADTRQLVEQNLRTIRDMAMGLRPTMLDDLGLGPALEWQARDFSRRSGLVVDLDMEGSLDDFPENYRIGIFRVLQEAFTNCARHAMAKKVRVVLHRGPGKINLLIQDDGKGFDPMKQSHNGMGLLSIKERIRELNGAVSIDSGPERGTTLQIELPNPQKGEV
jgi:signal transduction histidine kinase